ncbi:MAG TPA: hypothetical protein VFO25_08880 [Candidatus Eremiobacteraceae bacterium]|nr:hypothetical protein [Candidatus Eremiobacteraceae bacterium]
MFYVESLRVTRSSLVCALWLGIALAINLLIAKAGHMNVDQPMQFSLVVVWAFAGIITSIYASILGGSLARENDGHLPVAWTKPYSRPVHALAKMAVDLGGIAFVFALTCAVVFIYLAAIGVMRDIVVTPDTWTQLLRFFIAPAAFYGLVQALTSTLARRAGAVIGFTWVGLIGLIALSFKYLPPPFHAIVDFLNYANPLVYIAFDVDKNGTVVTYGTAAAAALALIAIIGSATAIIRWQRLEA